MLRPINTLEVPELVKLKLHEKGYEYCEDIEAAIKNNGTIPSSIKMIIHGYDILQQISSSKTHNIKTGSDLWTIECCRLPVVIFHKNLHKLLDGGIPIGRFTELCGAPGCGKTQMCFQFSIDVQFPSSLGGSEGEVLFISTDSSFRSGRIREMAEATIEHCIKIDGVDDEIMKNFTVKSILNGVNVIEIYGYESFVNVIQNVHRYFEKNHKIKLLIIDSFSLPIVCGVTDLLTRTKVINDILDVLLDLSLKHEFAVVLTNQLTTVITMDSEKKLLPSLGEGFGHRIHQRLLIDEGKICLLKSINRSQIYTSFEITESGIR